MSMTFIPQALRQLRSDDEPQRPPEGPKYRSTSSSARHEAVIAQLARSAASDGDSSRDEREPPPFPVKPELLDKLVVTAPTGSPLVEQYRKLAATLYHAQLADNSKIVMVASAAPSEGKTLTATNLALTFSESYRRRVLLIDADLRRPALHQSFQVPNVVGLRDALKAEIDQQPRTIEVTPQLSLLTAGRPDPDPMSGLTSDRMRRIIEEAAANFDWVIIDTPPVGLLPDANLLAGMVDLALLVIRANTTPHELITRAVDALGRNRILGVVLNCVQKRSVGGGYAYDYYNYHQA